jgi:hypothetical protein
MAPAKRGETFPIRAIETVSEAPRPAQDEGRFGNEEDRP